MTAEAIWKKPDTMDPRRKKLIFRCQHRGMKENDIFLGRFVAVHINDLDDSQIAQMEALLGEGDNDLYNWFSGKEPPPEAHDHDLMAWMKKFNNAL